jgi:hypothetical protein
VIPGAGLAEYRPVAGLLERSPRRDIRGAPALALVRQLSARVDRLQDLATQAAALRHQAVQARDTDLVLEVLDTIEDIKIQLMICRRQLAEAEGFAP